MNEKALHWNDKYLAGIPPWDRHGPSPALHAWLADGTLRPGRVLVPGCGRGREVLDLARAGFAVTALDIAPRALEHLRAELDQAGLDADLVQADVLHWQPEQPYDAIYEQTCLCALAPAEWHHYEAQLYGWLRPEGRLCALFMQTGREGGPPWHCALPEMRALFPARRWQWPETRKHPEVPHHDRQQFELAVVLTRR
jgi:SAM-dependent methyltransferase